MASCAAASSISTLSKNHSSKSTSSSTTTPLITSLHQVNSQNQKTSFGGLTLQEANKGIANSFISKRNTGTSFISKRGLEIKARSTAAKNIEVEVDKPLGLTLGQKQGGGVVITVKHKYRLAPRSRFPSDGGNPGMLCLEGVAQRDIKPNVSMRTKSQVDADLVKMRNMTPKEASAAAARADAEAEAPIAEAKEAAREADAADLDAEEDQAFAEAAMVTLRNRNTSKMSLD